MIPNYIVIISIIKGNEWQIPTNSYFIPQGEINKYLPKEKGICV